MARGLASNKHFLIHFSRSTSKLALFSKLIMWVERRPYSHACIELAEPATQMPLIFQASKGLINFFYKPTFEHHNKIVETWEVAVTPQEYINLWHYSVRKMGSDYGWKELVSIAIDKLFHVKGWFSDGDKTNICSELVARVSAKCGLKMPENLDNTTPSDLNTVLGSAANSGLVRRIL